MTSADTVERLRSVATATLIASLMKRGIRNAVLRRVLPLSPSTRKCVGPAFTMRNLPMREDKGHANVLADPNYPQRQMLESAPVGSVVVMDCHGEAGSAMADRCDLCIRVPSTSTPRIQEMHIAVGHSLCEMIEKALA